MSILDSVGRWLNSLSSRPLVADDFRLISSSGARPNHSRIYILNVQFKADSTKFEIELDRANQRAGKYDIAPGDSLQDALNDIYSGRPSSKLKWGKLGARVKNNGKKVRNPSDMSLNVSMDCFIIYQFKGNTNLRYTVDFNALSEDAKLRAPVFSHPSRIANGGQLIADVRDRATKEFPPKIQAAIVAYNHSLAVGEANADGDFEGRLNLHLDVVDDTDFDGRRSYIPIVVDPDVRFPGGNGGP